MIDIGPPIDVRPLFAPERRSLLDVLSALSSEEWWMPTVCGDWSVHDVVIHLLGADVNNLSGGRDQFRGSPLEPDPGDLSDWPTLVAFIDHRNATWIEGLRRISPSLLIDLLTWTGEQLELWWPEVDLGAPGIPVGWAGPDPAPTWLHLARELTERWTHQQHIRQAVDRPGGDDAMIVHAVLDAFARAMPFTLSELPAVDGTTVSLSISGEGGGIWTTRSVAGHWEFVADVDAEATCTVQTDVETAWQSFTLGLTPTERRARMRYAGPRELADRIVDMVTIIG
jgi:uncharacterized protein (TIGR03083 family)